VEYLEWADAEKTKRTKELKKKYQDVLDLNSKEYHEAWQEVRENWNQYRTCWFHYLDLLHLCNGKFMDSPEPINHTKLFGSRLCGLCGMRPGIVNTMYI
jgi:hypothetical protein